MARSGKILIALQHDRPYSEALRAQGWEVLLAEDTHKVYSTARHNLPAGVLLDTHLPRGGAETALNWLRSSPHTAAIPVVVLADGDGGRMLSLADAGAQRCLALDAPVATVCEAIQACVGSPPTPMQASSNSLSNAGRLAALRASGLVGTPPEEAYDRLTRLAARLVGAPVAAMTLIDRDRQYRKSSVGMADGQSRNAPLSESFCQWVVAGREPMVIEDSRTHPVLKHNAAVRHMGITAYAGIPVMSVDGQALGALCVVDSKPRTWNQAQIDTLTDLTHLAEMLVARAMLAQPSEPTLADMKRYASTGTETILSAVRILRRPDLTTEDRNLLLDEVETTARNLMKVRAAGRELNLQ